NTYTVHHNCVPYTSSIRHLEPSWEFSPCLFYSCCNFCWPLISSFWISFWGFYQQRKTKQIRKRAFFLSRFFFSSNKQKKMGLSLSQEGNAQKKSKKEIELKWIPQNNYFEIW